MGLPYSSSSVKDFTLMQKGMEVSDLVTVDPDILGGTPVSRAHGFLLNAFRIFGKQLQP
jgi:hypothetical protein